MPVVEIQIEAIERFAAGRSFGDTGSYLRIKGVAKGEIDPAAPENSVIADLGKAPRNARGMIEYETDFFIPRPAELRRANGVLVYDETNRGRAPSTCPFRPAGCKRLAVGMGIYWQPVRQISAQTWNVWVREALYSAAVT